MRQLYMLTTERALELLRADSGRLAEAATANMFAPIPSCPAWHMVDLVVHTGAVQRAQATIVETKAQEQTGIKREMFANVPGLLEWLEASVLFGGASDLESIPAGVVDWFREGAEELANVLGVADAETAVWSWSKDRTVRHYLRMLPIETAVHRWDAQNAVGDPLPIPEDLAVEGIGHTFEVMAPLRRQAKEAPAGSGESYTFSAKDTGRGWYVRFMDDAVLVETDTIALEALATIRAASASDLFLFLWGRTTVDPLELEGDEPALDRYWELVPKL